MVFADLIGANIKKMLERQANDIKQAAFEENELWTLLSRLAAFQWRIDRQPMATDKLEIENILFLQQRLEPFLQLVVDLGFLEKQANEKFVFRDTEIHDYLAAREFIQYLDGEYSDRGFVRDRAVQALEKIGEPAVPVLLEAWGSKDDSANLAIAVIFRRMGRSIVPLMEKVLRQGNRKIRRWVTEALISQENANAALSSLIELLNEDDQMLVRYGAITALGVSRNSDAEPAIINALNDSEPIIRSTAKQLLIDFGTPRARRAIENLLQQNETKANTDKNVAGVFISEEERVASKIKSAFDAPRIFLSYAREDANRVNEIRRLLKLAGFDPWIDSERLLAGPGWEQQLKEALHSSDFVLGLLSSNTPGGYQEQELQIALRSAPAKYVQESTPFVLSCVIDEELFGNAGNHIPSFLKESHLLNLINLETGWENLYRSLSVACRSAGLLVPPFIRSTPLFDLDHSGANAMIIQKNFYDSLLNKRGCPPSFKWNILSQYLLEDKNTGRVWLRGCIENLPEIPEPTIDNTIAELTPDRQSGAAEKAKAEATMMENAIKEHIRSFNDNAVGGYTGWRLPTLEEAMSIVTNRVQEGGMYISTLFSDHPYVRTADHNYHPYGIGENSANGYRTVWCVDYSNANCLEIPAQGPIPLRLVTSIWKF